MTSPRGRSRRPSTPSFLILTEDHNTPLPTRSGALASLMRTRSQSSLNSVNRHSRDEETANVRPSWSHTEEDDIGRLLADEHRLSQILHGTKGRSMNLLGKSNPRYRWERYWRHEHELKEMQPPL